MKRALLVAALALAGVVSATAAARADLTESPRGADYDPYSSLWNGMARFVALAEGMGFTVEPVQALEWDDLSATDILVLVYPLQRVDPSRLGAFVQAGGNVLIADDFGNGREAMRDLGLWRADVVTPKAIRYEDNQTWAPVATARGDHPLAKDVGEVVTNHPAALTKVIGADIIVAFEEGALVVAGERGSGKFIAISDPSIFINLMQQHFRGNVQLAINCLRWLDRGGRAKRVVLLRGDVPMYGDPRAFIDDPRGSKLARSITDFNYWLSKRDEWLLTPFAMKVLAVALAVLLLGLALAALPIRRGTKIDGAWLRFDRPTRRDEPHALVGATDHDASALLVLACIVRDQVQVVLAGTTGKVEPLYALSEGQLVAEVSKQAGRQAGQQLARVYKRLRALPSRGQAAAPWSSGHLARRDFEQLYADASELCRSLGSPLPA